jgi:Lrp/AsnC family transcriptional regulator, leucine-responsive regulatory protein
MEKRTVAALSHVGRVAASGRPVVTLDKLDVALLGLLAVDGRASQRSLAASLGVSTPTVSERMSRLERAGVITGYAAQVDWAAIGITETVYLSVTAAAGYDVATIMQELWQIPQVQDVNLVTGDLDLLVRLRVRDNNHLRSLLMDQIWQIDGIQRTSTMTSMAEMPGKNFAARMLAEMAPTPAADAG